MEKNNAGFGVLLGMAYVFKEEVSDIVALVNGYVRVDLQAGGQWKELYFTPGTGQWNEQSKDSRAGKVQVMKAQITAPQENTEDWKKLNELDRREVLIRLAFNTGYKLVGSKEAPVDLMVETDSQGGMETRLGFEHEAEERARWMAMVE